MFLCANRTNVVSDSFLISGGVPKGKSEGFQLTLFGARADKLSTVADINGDVMCMPGLWGTGLTYPLNMGEGKSYACNDALTPSASV